MFNVMFLFLSLVSRTTKSKNKNLFHFLYHIIYDESFRADFQNVRGSYDNTLRRLVSLCLFAAFYES